MISYPHYKSKRKTPVTSSLLCSFKFQFPVSYSLFSFPFLFHILFCFPCLYSTCFTKFFSQFNTSFYFHLGIQQTCNTYFHSHLLFCLLSNFLHQLALCQDMVYVLYCITIATFAPWCEIFANTVKVFVAVDMFRSQPTDDHIAFLFIRWPFDFISITWSGAVLFGFSFDLLVAGVP
jgi:hypothetical protein